MKVLLFLSLLSVSAIAMQKLTNVHMPPKLGNAELLHDDNGIYLLKGKVIKPIENHQCDQILRKLIANRKLKEFQKHGTLRVNTMGSENEEIIVRAHVHGNGGGPILATGLYFGVKFLGCLGLVGGAVIANAAAPGAGAVATGVVLGAGGVAGAAAGIETAAISTAVWALALPTP